MVKVEENVFYIIADKVFKNARGAFVIFGYNPENRLYDLCLLHQKGILTDELFKELYE